jgi:SAM-dependent methyltransferase
MAREVTCELSEVEEAVRKATFASVEFPGFGARLERVATAQTATAGGVTEASDIVPGRYEGGLKVWECARSLAELVFEKSAVPPPSLFEGARVLEIGCGHGLPGLAALCHGRAASVHFCDFNEDVLRAVTMPNVLRNRGTLAGARFFAGDWRELAAALPHPRQYDVVLSSDTVYCPESIAPLVGLIGVVLRQSPSGVAYVAGRRFYFGVGGGTRDLCAAVQPPLVAAREKHFSQGVEREIIALTWGTTT